MAQLQNYKVISNAAIKVHCGKTDEMLIRGLQSTALPFGFTTETITVDVMGERIAKVLPTGGSYEEISIDYAWAPNDPSQTYMQQASLNNVEVRDMRFYVDDNNICGGFAALDLISDPSGSYRVGSMTSPSGSKSELFTGSLTITPAGPSTYYGFHAYGTDLSFTTGAGASVAATNQDFVELGFEAGMVVLIDRLDDLDPLQVQIDTVAAKLMTFVDGVGDEALIPTAAGGADTAIHAGAPMVVSNDASVSCD